MERYREYCINNHYVNIGDLDRYYQGNMDMVCRHIESNYLVDHETSSYYVNLYMQDKPFKMKDSVLSTIAICFCLPLVLCAPLFLDVICIVTSLTLAIIDLALKSSEQIPRRHVGSIVAIVICVLSALGLIFVDHSSTDTAKSHKKSNNQVESEIETEKESDSSQGYQRVEARVGEEITYQDNVYVTLTNFYENTNYDYEKPKSGYKYVTFSFQVVNNSDETFSFSYTNATGYADNVQVENTLYLTDSSSILELSPGRTGNVDISFEVPTNAQSIEMDYNFNPFTDDVGVFIGQ